MESVQFLNDGHGRLVSQNSSNIEMCVLGNFLSTDVCCYNIIVYKEWAADPKMYFASGNITQLEKEGNYVYLSDLYPEEGYFAKLKMTTEQFIKMLDDWEQKVCKLKPQEAIIKYENDEFVFETKP